jgi:uncharacterized protein with NRDE domain
VCTLAAFVRVFPAYPLVVAANRDEYLDRPATPPTLLREAAPRAMGGRDLRANGTWLGVNEARVVVGVLNRRSPAPPDPARRSRGQLAVELLGYESASAAAVHAAGEPFERYNPFNLLIADPSAAFAVTHPHDGPLRSTPLEPGLHLLTNLDVNDSTCPRIAVSCRRFAAAGDAFAGDGGVDAFVRGLRDVLADHATALDPRGPGSLCVHAGPFGTRSSSVLLVPPAGRPVRYLHADGPPCRTPFAPVPLPF